MARNIKEVEKELSKLQKAIRKINEKEAKEGGLSNVDAGTRNTYRKQLKELEAEKESILNGGSGFAEQTHEGNVDSEMAENGSDMRNKT